MQAMGVGISKVDSQNQTDDKILCMISGLKSETQATYNGVD